MEATELTAVRSVILASAPERQADFERLWDEHSPHLALLDDRPRFVLEAGPFGIVQFTARTMQQVWLLSFAAWRALHAYQALFELATVASGGLRIDVAAWLDVPDQKEAEELYASAINGVKALNSVDTAATFEWPSSIPRPGPSVVFRSAEEQAAFDLACIATAAAFLHELRHLTLAAEQAAPVDPIREELECDRFARSFLLERVLEYADRTGYAAETVRIKRTLGLALTCFTIWAVTPQSLWHGSDTHPPVSARFAGILDAARDFPIRSWFWSVLASWLVAHLKFLDRLPDVLAGSNVRDLTHTLIDHI